MRRPAYDLQTLRGDIFGGVTTAVVGLPVALAFGVASGMGAMAGLYGAIALGFFAAVCGGIPGGAVDENAQGNSARRRFPAAVASPIIRDFCDAISVPRDVPRSKTTERSAPRGCSARSRSTKRRRYSASEMPCSAARARASACRSESSDIWVRTIIVAP